MFDSLRKLFVTCGLGSFAAEHRGDSTTKLLKCIKNTMNRIAQLHANVLTYVTDSVYYPNYAQLYVKLLFTFSIVTLSSQMCNRFLRVENLWFRLPSHQRA